MRSLRGIDNGSALSLIRGLSSGTLVGWSCGLPASGGRVPY